ncbi:MAG TPA: pyridoxamine 5'-phosphate oxidase family protein [Roseiflexaceae bacterium]|nr:pyridoxamine 5'-phosphate oxidase family protein [Roseiflexaceae bacterium]
MSEPHRSRPRVPSTYKVPESEDTLLPWSHAREQLEHAQNFWVITASADAVPHATPLWGVWFRDRMYLEGHPATKWARNLAANPYAIVHLDSSDNVVTVEGLCYDVPDVGDELYEQVVSIYAAKYNGYRPEDHGFWVLTPKKAFAWTQFPQTATRFTFE